MHSQHEAREKIFAVNLYLRKKANKPSLVRAKVEGEFRTAPRFRVGDGRPGGMQVQDRDELIAKPAKWPKAPMTTPSFLHGWPSGWVTRSLPATVSRSWMTSFSNESSNL